MTANESVTVSVPDALEAGDVMAVQGAALDWGYIRDWCGRHGTISLMEEMRKIAEGGGLGE